MNPTTNIKSEPNPLTISLRVRDSSLEEPLRLRFATALPDATMIIHTAECENFADIDSISGNCDGPDKPMVKAQEIVGEFNAALRERKETNTPTAR